MILTAVWSLASLAHDPDREAWIGLPIEGDETPPRANAMKAALESVGLAVTAPEQHVDGPILAVHDHGMLTYLKTAYADWLDAGYPDEPGQDRVVPYAFRHPAAFDHTGRVEPRSRAARAGIYCMDTCTTIGPGTYRGIRYAVDAALTAADLVLSGSGNAYAAIRPPGHHAGTNYFGGSCYLNNAAITAQYLRDHGATRIGIIDIDAHHGNGTQQIFYEREDVVYASVHIDPGEGWYPHWSGFGDETGSGNGAGYNRNLALASGSGDGEFVSAVETLAGFLDEKRCDSLVVSLGVDAGTKDENSPLTVTTDGFGSVATILAGLELPTVLVQEGGYHLLSLERDLSAILSRFSSDTRPRTGSRSRA